MAKVTSLLGGLRGKASNMVFAKTGGSVIMREYNPTVSNPNTARQVGQRTKFKLLSQLAASMADVIAIPKSGLVSGRNRFMSINTPFADVVEGIAQVTYENLQLTDGTFALPGIHADRTSDKGGYIELHEGAAQNIDRVIYAVFAKNAEEILQLRFSAISSIPGDDRKFKIDGLTLEGELVIYAYGMRDLNAQATAKYGNYFVENASDLAKLISDRSISTSDYKFTRTRGATLYQGQDETQTPEPGKVHCYVTSTAGGSAKGSGDYAIGDSVTLTATPDDGFDFKGWKRQGASTYLSTKNPYTFNIQNQMDIVAEFEKNNLEG